MSTTIVVSSNLGANGGDGGVDGDALDLHEGTNTVNLSTLVPYTSGATSSTGSCNGSFDTVDIHIQAYGCFTTDVSTQTLSNFRVQ